MFCWLRLRQLNLIKSLTPSKYFTPAILKKSRKNAKQVVHFKWGLKRFDFFFVLASFPSLSQLEARIHKPLFCFGTCSQYYQFKNYICCYNKQCVRFFMVVLRTIPVSLPNRQLTWKRNVLQLGSISTLSDSVGNPVEAYNKATKHGS